ncbi:MAG: alginate O-acetyltransferase complex protein AlgJ [Verrucomicrobiota bacterium]
MAEQKDIPVGHDEPLKPTHSLPLYSEPTPETHRKLSRESEAEIALKHTRFTAGSRSLLIVLFLFTILAVPAVQFAVEMRGPPEGPLGTFKIYRAYPAWTKIRAVRSAKDLWHLLPHAADLKSAEKELETASVVSEWLLPRVQRALLKLGVGNEQVYLGRDGWLFYRPDVDYVTGPPFLAPKVMTQRAHAAAVQPDAVKAIVAFRDQLAARGIGLTIVPVPSKATIHPEKLTEHITPEKELQNASFEEFRKRVTSAGVHVSNPAIMMMAVRRGTGHLPQYLATDTHWTPEAMQYAAYSMMVSAAADLPAGQTHGTVLPPKEIVGKGDLARMLKLPDQQRLYPPEKVMIEQVMVNNQFWRPSPDADVLLLGDSFSNIFSLEALGWGESAGLAEHFSAKLGGRPVDCILRNSDGAFATREILSHELARGKDRLAGKKLVIWEFAARELAFGDWKMLDMKLGKPMPPKFFVPKTSETVTASGTIEAISTVPRPGTVPYREHILAVHLTDLAVEGRPPNDALESLVYLASMRDNVLTPAARLGPGDRVKLRLRAWTDVSDRYEKINRSEIDDPAVQLEEPCWGEPVNN